MDPAIVIYFADHFNSPSLSGGAVWFVYPTAANIVLVVAEDSSASLALLRSLHAKPLFHRKR
jgi:hypothetical protein